MTTTGIEITAMGEVRGIGPWSAGSVAAALKGEDPIVATAQNMIGVEHRRLATAAMKGAESGNERDTGTGRTADRHLWKGPPTKKSISGLEGVMVCRLLLNPLGAHQNYLGRLLKLQILGPQPRRI